VRLNFQATLDLSAPVPDPNLGREKGALLLRVLNRLRLENKNAFLAGALGAGPSVTMRLYINDEPGAHVGQRVLHNYSQNVYPFVASSLRAARPELFTERYLLQVATLVCG
jgi:hypothetical protein